VLLLDTHALFWLAFGTADLGRSARTSCDTALKSGNLHVSAISFWEAALLQRLRRLALHMDVAAWRQSVFRLGVVELPIDGEIGIAANHIEGFHKDPADRLIVATALKHGSMLLTADRRILAWDGALDRQDARA
jgi:PIN domain nuclease of toxin-antitoxin system